MSLEWFYVAGSSKPEKVQAIQELPKRSGAHGFAEAAPIWAKAWCAVEVSAEMWPIQQEARGNSCG